MFFSELGEVMGSDPKNFNDHANRFTPLDLGNGVWAVFDIESTFEDNSEAYISYWWGEADSAEDAVRLAKEAWGDRITL